MPRRELLGVALSWVVLVLYWGRAPEGLAVVPVAAALILAVMLAVHQAERVAHLVGEPFGTLILAVSVTAIEVGLIVTLMASDPEKSTALARDTVFAAVMIVINLVVGLGIVVGTMRHRSLQFSNDASSGLLATLGTLAALTLVLPTFTTSTPGPTYTGKQLALAAVCAVVLYGVFVLVQTVVDRPTYTPDAEPESDPPHDSHGRLLPAVALLLPSLVAVVALAKTSSGAIDELVEQLGATGQLKGVVLALLVLLPETITAVRSARRGELQTTINLALGSGIASIGLTIPAVALASIWIDGPLVLGLESKELVLLTLSMVLAAVTLSRGRVTVLHGAIHLTVLLVFVFLTIEP